MSEPPDPKIRWAGQALSRAIARFPASWRVVGPAVTRFFDRRADTWDVSTGAGSLDHLAGLAAALGRLDNAPERILDLGCGTGEGTLFLAREYPRASVRGVDISQAMVARATAKVGLDPEARVAFRVADASRLPFAEDSFDLVCQVNVPLFHSELRRVLRQGGRLVIVSSHGAKTPFHTPETTVVRVLGRQGFDLLERGESGSGTFMVFGLKQ